MGWLWGEKTVYNKKIPFTQSQREEGYRENKVMLHLELTVRSPNTLDIVRTLEEVKIDYVLPPNTTVEFTTLKRLELLGDRDL